MNEIHAVSANKFLACLTIEFQFFALVFIAEQNLVAFDSRLVFRLC
jgi:hypothetical protein